MSSRKGDRREVRRAEARRREAAKRGGRRTTIIGLAVAAIVLGAAAVAVLATQRPASGPAGSAASAGSSASAVPLPLVSVGPLPRFESSTNDPAVGQPVPSVEGFDFDGRPVTITPGPRPKVAIFLAHWCPHCQREVPVIQGWLDERGPPEGVDLVSVVTSIDPALPNYPPDAWLDRERWSVPVIVDPDGRIASAYGLNAFPYFVLIDAEGRVAGRTTGELPVETLDQIVAQLAGS